MRNEKTLQEYLREFSEENRRFIVELVKDQIREVVDPDFGWIWREDELGGIALARARMDGNMEMLDRIRGSLKEYPNLGGDIEVMNEVDRLVNNARREGYLEGYEAARSVYTIADCD